MFHRPRLSLTIGLIAALASQRPVSAGELASAWTSDRTETKSRLIAGVAGGKPVAGVEIALDEGWKTYWRFPGDAGGVPPSFDWARSDNVASVTVLYPAPKRLTDKAGDTLGYKSGVVFPVLVEAKDPTRPVTLKLTLEYGVCKDICIPVEAEQTLDIAPGAASVVPLQVLAALDHVPRAGPAVRPTDPKLLKTEVHLDGPQPSIALEAEFPGGSASAEAFIEAPPGAYIPLPKAGSTKDLGHNRLRFEIDLTGIDPADLRGKLATLTLVSKEGVSETTFKLE